ncbi:MAG: DUF4145 domain-containing protein [Rickettsiales bacterium]|nr:DUF4145 domain-containing protein [Rickettsiales bacterium]
MPILVEDCPRCGAVNMTFDVTSINRIKSFHDWQNSYEAFSICRHCNTSSICILRQKTVQNGLGDPNSIILLGGSLNSFFNSSGFVNLSHSTKYLPPEYLPEQIKSVFIEGTICLSVECWNAAGTMFRQCLDLATKPMLPQENINGLTNHQRRNLAPRLTWLFDNNKLSKDFENLATCIREDGNDGAHDGTLTKEDALDLFDFTFTLLERVFTESAKLNQAEGRRLERRAKASSSA